VPVPNLSHWDKLLLQAQPVPVGQADVLVPEGQVVLVPNLSQWERSKETCPCPMEKSYTHAGGLSLSEAKPYDHDGTCPSPTCRTLSHKVGLQGRGTLYCPFGKGPGQH